MKFIFHVLTLLLSGTMIPPCYSQHTKNILPDYISIQYAGSTGWLNAGAGYSLFKDRGRLGAQYGFVPEEKGGRLHILSSSFFFKPYVLHVSKTLHFNPLDTGVKISYHFGEQFFLNLPSRYPDGYYWWKSALKLHLATESSVTFKFANSDKAKSITIYLELNSNELYMVSYVLNLRSISLADIIKAGAGVRFNF